MHPIRFSFCYEGPIGKSAYAQGLKAPIHIESGENSYEGALGIRLSRSQTDAVEAHLHLFLPAVAREPMEWDTREGGTVRLESDGPLKSILIIEGLESANARLGQVLTAPGAECEVLGGIGRVRMRQTEAPAREKGMLAGAWTDGERLRLDIEAPTGTALDIKLYGPGESLVGQLGVAGLTTAQPRENVEFALDETLAPGAYQVVIDSAQGRASIPIVVGARRD